MLFKKINHKDEKPESLQKDSATPHAFFKVKSGVKVGALDWSVLSVLSLDNLSQSSGTLDQTLQESAFNRA